MAKDWAAERQIPVETFEADWATHGKAAGPIRNRKMLDAGADLVLAFPVGNSKTSPGTWDCIEAAAERGIPVRIFPKAAARVCRKHGVPEKHCACRDEVASP
jgi:hypothetical protein